MKFVLAFLVLIGLVGMSFAQHHSGGGNSGHAHSAAQRGHHPPAGVHPIAPAHGRMVRVQNYHLVYGHAFKYGYWYSGWNHAHWSLIQWSPGYGCYIYFDPYCGLWFYWCAPHYRYYPVTYCPLGIYVFPYVANPQPPVGPIPAPPVQ